MLGKWTCSMNGFFHTFNSPGTNLLRILIDRGSEYCGARKHHEYELNLALKMSITPKPKLNHQKQMASMKDLIELCRKIFMPLPSERKSIILLMNSGRPRIMVR